MELIFPAKYFVRSSSGWTQRGTIEVRAENGRLARIKAREEIERRCGLRPAAVEIGTPR